MRFMYVSQLTELLDDVEQEAVTHGVHEKVWDEIDACRAGIERLEYIAALEICGCMNSGMLEGPPDRLFVSDLQEGINLAIEIQVVRKRATHAYQSRILLEETVETRRN